MRFLRLLRTCIDKMVNWHDPAILLKDYSAFRTFRISIDIDSLLVAFDKLNHAIAGIYLCIRLRWQEITH